jgi:uncharacterized membrane protein
MPKNFFRRSLFMRTLPSNVSTLFLVIFAISFVLFVLVPLAFGYWRLAHAPLSEVRAATIQPGTLVGLLIGLIAITIVLVVLGDSVQRMPSEILYPTIGIIDLLFVFFLCEQFIAAWIIRRRMHILEARLEEN